MSKGLRPGGRHMASWPLSAPPLAPPFFALWSICLQRLEARAPWEAESALPPCYAGGTDTRQNPCYEPLLAWILMRVGAVCGARSDGDNFGQPRRIGLRGSSRHSSNAPRWGGGQNRRRKRSTCLVMSRTALPVAYGERVTRGASRGTVASSHVPCDPLRRAFESPLCPQSKHRRLGTPRIDSSRRAMQTSPILVSFHAINGRPRPV